MADPVTLKTALLNLINTENWDTIGNGNIADSDCNANPNG